MQYKIIGWILVWGGGGFFVITAATSTMIPDWAKVVSGLLALMGYTLTRI